MMRSVLLTLYFVLFPLPLFAGDYTELFTYRDDFFRSYENKPSFEIEKNAWFFTEHHFRRDAITLFSDLLKKEPENELYNFGVAVNLRLMGKELEAINYYKKAFPNLSSLKGEKIIVEIDKTEKEKNRKITEKLLSELEKDENNFGKLKEISEYFGYMGELDKAVYYAKKALTIKDDYFLKLRLARLYYLKEDYENAISLYKSMDSDGQNLYVQLCLSASYLKSSDKKRAKLYYERVLNSADNKQVVLDVFKSYLGIWDRETDVYRLFRYINPAFLFGMSFYENSSNFSRFAVGEELIFKTNERDGFSIGHNYNIFRKEYFKGIERNRFYLSTEKSLARTSIFRAEFSDNFYSNNLNSTGFLVSFGQSLGGLFTNLQVERFDIIDTEKNFSNQLYNYSSEFGSVAKVIKSTDYSLFFDYRVNEHYRLMGKLIYGEYNEGNIKIPDFLILYTPL